MIKKADKPKILVIVGPTTSGKTALSIKLAKKYDGEIVSADSRQVYKYIDLASGKITKKEMGKIPHHLIDVVDPNKTFTVSDYQKLAKAAIQEILSKGKMPIVCGGTGFYIDAIINNTVLPEVPPNQKLRKSLSKLPVEKLFERLCKIDPARSENIDSKNPVRLIRAIEIAEKLGSVPKTSTTSPYSVEFVKIDLEDEILHKKIQKRIDERFNKGMVKEVKDLHEKHGVSWRRLFELGLECRYISLYLQNKVTEEEMKSQLFSDTKKYVKRQRTWFKRYTN